MFLCGGGGHTFSSVWGGGEGGARGLRRERGNTNTNMGGCWPASSNNHVVFLLQLCCPDGVCCVRDRGSTSSHVCMCAPPQKQLHSKQMCGGLSAAWCGTVLWWLLAILLAVCCFSHSYNSVGLVG